MSKTLSVMLMLLAGVSITNLATAQDPTVQRTSGQIRSGVAGCGGVKEYPIAYSLLENPDVGFLEGFPIVWVNGREGFRALGSIEFGPRKPIVIFPGVGCDTTAWQQREVEVYDLALIGSNAVVAPRNPAEVTRGVNPDSVNTGFIPTSVDTLVMASISVAPNGQMFQLVTPMTNCYFDPTALESWWCVTFGDHEHENVPFLGIIFTSKGGLVGRALGRVWDAEGTKVKTEFFSDQEKWALAAQFAVPTETPTELPSGFSMGNAWPNPTLGPAEIPLRIDTPQHIRAGVYDTRGRLIETLVDGYLPSGEHAFRFDGSRLPSGLYLVRVAGDRTVKTARVVLIR